MFYDVYWVFSSLSSKSVFYSLSHLCPQSTDSAKLVDAETLQPSIPNLSLGRSGVFKVWSRYQQHRHHLGTCQKYISSGTSQTYQIRESGDGAQQSVVLWSPAGESGVQSDAEFKKHCSQPTSRPVLGCNIIRNRSELTHWALCFGNETGYHDRETYLESIFKSWNKKNKTIN